MNRHPKPSPCWQLSGQIGLALLLWLMSCYSLAKPVQVGDLIQVNLPGETSLNKTFIVDKTGRINLPEVGHVYVVGFEQPQLENRVLLHLKQAFRDIANAKVYVAKRQMLISVQGYVQSPGEYTLPESSTVQMAIFAAGGLRAGAQLDKLQHKRGGQSRVFNYKTFLDTGADDSLPTLRSLDSLFVPASPLVGNIEQAFDSSKLVNAGDGVDPRTSVKVFGEVNAPGSFSYKENMDLVDIIMRSGGVTRYASVEQIRVISNSRPSLFNLKHYLDTGDASLLPILQPGATVFVPKMEEEIKSGANTVYVMGEVAAPGAYQGNRGANFIDILANAGGPTRYAESRQIRIIKSSGQVISFDLTAFTEGLTQQKLPTIDAGDAIFVPEKTDMNEKSWLKISPDRAVNVIGQVARPGRIEWSNEMNLMDLLAHVGGPTLRADTSAIEVINSQGNIVIFDLDRFIKQGANPNALPSLAAGSIVRVQDLPQDPTDNKAQWVRQASEASIYVFGQVNAPGRYRFTKEMHFLDILAAADGPSLNADIHNIRVSHRNNAYARVSKLNLALYFETGDESLLPKVTMGDSIYIPEKNKNWLDRSKESTIRILGAVHKPGRYEFNDNMTILDLLAEAGGTTDQAYLKKISVVHMPCCQSQAVTFDLSEFSRTANVRMLPVLRAGDMVFVPQRSDSLAAKLRSGFDDVIKVATTIVLIGAL